MSSLNSRRRNHPPKSDTQITPTAIFSKPPPAQCCRRRCLVNPELLGCHFGSGNAIGYLLKRDVTSVVG
jgi:hypothetical protein